MNRKILNFLNICDLKGGTQPPKSTFSSTPKENYVRLLQIQDFSSDQYQIFVKKSDSLSYCEKNDILIGRYGASVGKVFRGKSGAHNVALIKAVIDDEVIDRDYFYYFLQGDLFQSHLKKVSARAAQAGFSKSDFIDFKVSIPSTISLQRHIAARLKTQLAEVEAARQAAQAQLNDSRILRNRLLKGFFAELDNSPKKKLGDYAGTNSGSTPSRGNKQYWQPAEIAWVKTGEVAFAPITATEEAISKKALAECSLSLLPPKTILIAMIGQGKTRGQSAILEIPATTNQNCFAVLPNDTWEPDFLYLWVKSSYQDLRDLSADRGGSQSALNGALLRALEVPAPSKAEQQQIVSRIHAAMTEIDAIENSSKVALEGINYLTSRLLAQAFKV